MKEKLLVALKTKYKTFGFGDKAFDGVADYLSKTVTEESQVETAIGGVEGLLKSFQGDVDVVRNEKSGLQKQLDELKAKSEKAEPIEKTADQKDDVATIIANAINAAVKPISDELAGLKAKDAQSKRQSDILAKAKEYGIPESQARRYAITDDADLDAYFKDAKQELINAGFESARVPESGGEMKTDSSDIVSAINKGTQELKETN